MNYLTAPQLLSLGNRPSHETFDTLSEVYTPCETHTLLQLLSQGFNLGELIDRLNDYEIPYTK